jgi:hypothetical protein
MTVEPVEPFRFHSCEMAIVSTGLVARTLSELRDCVRRAPEGSLHTHFWGWKMRPQLGEREYTNDLANWVASTLRDRGMAEKLSALSPKDFEDLDSLREEIISVLDRRLEGDDAMAWSRASHPFFFTDSRMLVFDTGQTASTLKEFREAIRTIDTNSIFYHVIDAVRRTPGHEDDFSAWLSGFGELTANLRARLRRIDTALLTLGEIREKINSAIRKSLPWEGDEQ